MVLALKGTDAIYCIIAICCKCINRSTRGCVGRRHCIAYESVVCIKLCRREARFYFSTPPTSLIGSMQLDETNSKWCACCFVLLICKVFGVWGNSAGIWYKWTASPRPVVHIVPTVPSLTLPVARWLFVFYNNVEGLTIVSYNDYLGWVILNFRKMHILWHSVETVGCWS